MTCETENYEPIFLSQYIIETSKLEKINKLGQGNIIMPKNIFFKINKFLLTNSKKSKILGISAVVYLMSYNNRGKPLKVADKSIPILLVELKDIKREIELISSCNHKNIVKFIGYYEKNEYFHIVTEYMEGGDLAKYLKNENNVNLKKIFVKFVLIVETDD